MNRIFKKSIDKIQSIPQKQKIRIVGIFIAVIIVIAVTAIVLVMKDYKTKSVEIQQSVNIENETKSGISIEFTYYEDYWKKYDLTNAVYKTQEEYENAVRKYIDEIAILVNKQNWYAQYSGMNTLCLELHINDLESVSVQGGVLSYKESTKRSTCTYELYLSNEMFKNNRSQLAQAISNLVLTKKHGELNDVEKGLTEYIQNSLGMGIASVNYGVDIHNYLIAYTKIKQDDKYNKASMDSAREGLGKISTYTNYIGTHDKYKLNDEVVYKFNEYKVLCYHSFVDYLVQTYGFESVLKIADGYDDSIYNMFSPNGLKGLLEDWKNFLENYNGKMTWDEIDANISVLKKTQ